jgi:DNA-3-methyladenine glycosylase
MKADSLSRSFFEREPDAVAHDLIGCLIIVRDDERTTRARIVETEAYGGNDDPASHAYRGPTPRTEVMFGRAGILYVYRSYGIHWCMNVVTGGTALASAVLLRAAELVDVHGDVDANDPSHVSLSGPGNLTRGLGISGSDNAEDCCAKPAERIWFEARALESNDDVGQSPRIGLSRAVARRSRYFLQGSDAVTKISATTRRQWEQDDDTPK